VEVARESLQSLGYECKSAAQAAMPAKAV